MLGNDNYLYYVYYFRGIQSLCIQFAGIQVENIWRLPVRILLGYGLFVLEKKVNVYMNWAVMEINSIRVSFIQAIQNFW